MGRFFIERGAAGAEFAARARPEGGGGRIAVDREVVEFLENLAIGCDGRIVEFVAKVLAEAADADAKGEGDLVLRHAEFGESGDFVALFFGEVDARDGRSVFWVTVANLAWDPYASFWLQFGGGVCGVAKKSWGSD